MLRRLKRQFRLFFLLTLLSVCASALLTPGTGAWQTTVAPGNGSAFDVAVDAAGDVISAGNLEAYTVAKMSGATGEVKWRYSPGSGVSVSPSDVAVDSAGDVFVAMVNRSFVTKLSGVDGTPIWTRNLGGTINRLESTIYEVKVDRNGDVVTAGSIGGLFNVNKLDGRSGDELWHYEREGLGMAVAVDPSGDVAASGIMNKNFGVVKLHGASGVEAWQREINGAGNFSDVFEEANSVAMDSDGSVIAAGITSNSFANFRDFTVAKYTPNGDLQWLKALDGGWCEINDRGERVCQANDEAHAVAVGRDGSVFAAGSLQEDGTSLIRGANENFHVVKISRDGEVVWSRPAEEAPFGQEYTRGRALTLSVDGVGDVVAAGIHGERFTVVKFTGGGSRAGERVWLKQVGLVPAQGNSCIAWEVATDASGDVAVVGNTLASNQFPLYTVVKLRGADGSDYFGAPRPDVPETVTKYAPLVYLYPNDDYRPGDPLTFIRNSKLGWSHQATAPPGVACPGGDHEVAARGAVDAGKLGAASPSPYAHSPLNHANLLCRDYGEDMALKAGDYTRPFDGPKRDNILGELEGYMKEGIFLDPENDDGSRRGVKERPGAPFYSGVPVFYEYVRHAYVTYWFFYPYDEYRFLNSLGQEVPIQSHEGDWERISIQLDGEDLPVNIFYYAHEDGSIVPWGTVDVYGGTHPIVFSAKGSHASYPDAGSYHTKLPGAMDEAAQGPKWATWEDLADVTTQPWYGFGGAWGEVSGLIVIETPLGTLSGGDYTGPLGPSPYKTSRSQWFHSITGRVTDAQGRPSNGVVLTLREHDNVKATTTGPDGRYSFVDLTFGRTYAITPSKEGFSFNPAARAFSDLRKSQTADFIARDLIPPALSLPADMTVDAYVPQGATVYYDVTATDNVTSSPRVDCAPPSGALFNIGSTTVMCTASDEDGNTTRGSFTVTVKGAASQMTGLLSVIRQLGLKKGDENKLTNELEQALKASALGQTDKACRNLDQFEKKVQQEKGKGLTAQQATQLITSATRISTVIGCR